MPLSFPNCVYLLMQHKITSYTTFAITLRFSLPSVISCNCPTSDSLTQLVLPADSILTFIYNSKSSGKMNGFSSVKNYIFIAQFLIMHPHLFLSVSFNYG